MLQPKQLSVEVESKKDRKCTIMRRLAAFSLHFVLRRDFSDRTSFNSDPMNTGLISSKNWFQ